MLSIFNVVTLPIFLLMVVILVVAHELGHYLFARLFKMEVEEFAVGMGRPKWIWKKKNGTEYTFRPLPLGGFVRIKGMQPQEDGGETQIENGFYSKPPIQRFVVLLMGPVFSIIAGILTLVPIFMTVGYPDSSQPVIGMLTKGDPAELAGLKPDDRVLAIDGKPVNSWHDMIVAVRDRAGQPLEFRVKRGPEAQTITITPAQTSEPVPVMGPDGAPEPGVPDRIQGKIGALPAMVRKPMGVGESIQAAVELPFKVIGSLAMSIVQGTIKDQVGGPITMVAATRATVEEGPADVIQLAGMLSISLGIFNLLPIFPLDGGQMLVALVEMFRRGRRLSFKVQERIAGAGFLLVILMFASVMLIDVQRWFGAKEEPTLKLEKVQPKAQPKAEQGQSTQTPKNPGANPKAPTAP